jgi:uncharacterized protein (DUF488 family)
METDQLSVFTIGHSNHLIEKFIELLRLHRIEALADVRSAPASRFNPQFNKKPLAECLKQAGIAYVFLGHELGARSEDPATYENGRVQYRKLAATPLFRSGIERVEQGARKMRISLMCAEKDPLDCHRTLLVGRALERDHVAVTHILADGALESQYEAMRRLLKFEPAGLGDMFDAEETLIELAVQRRAGQVAYEDERMVQDGAQVVPES